MQEMFYQTKEVSLKTFEAMWAKGGTRTVGTQYSNCAKADYLMVVDTKASNFKKQKEAELEAFHASIPTYSLGGVGRHPVSIEDERRLRQMQAEVQCIDDVVTNIVESFHAGWVTSGLRATGSHKEKQEVTQLPDNWEECFLVYENYPTFKRVLVARNNMDGTVQLFRA